MVKQKIDFFDSVEETSNWQFVKQKKAMIKTTSGKDVTSEFYITFKQPQVLFVFLFIALAPSQAFSFTKIQQIIKKIKGQNNQLTQKYEDCKKSLNLNWDGSTPLPNILRQYKHIISEQQQNLFEISQRLDDEQARRIIKSGLSQRKIHLDYYSNDGQYAEELIPSVQNAQNYVAVIFNSAKDSWLLAFFSNTQPKTEALIQNQQKQKQPQKQDPKIANNVDPKQNSIDDRPLVPPAQHLSSKNNIQNPDDRLLIPPSDLIKEKPVKRVPTVARKIINPDEKFLSPPAPNQEDDDKFQDLKIVGKKYGQRKIQNIDDEKKNTDVQERIENKNNLSQFFKAIKIAIPLGLAISILRVKS